VIAGLLVAVVLIAVVGTGVDAPAVLSRFATYFLGIFLEAAPFLLLGALVSGLIDSFVSADDIARWVPRQPVLATIMGAFLGFAFPVCECGVVPVVRRLYAKGLPTAAGVTFLLAAPVMNPVVLASTYAVFGFGAVLIGRFVITAVVAIAVGLVFAFTAHPSDVLRPVALAPVMGGSSDVIPLLPARKPLRRGLMDALNTATSEYFDMGRYLIIGTLLAALMKTLVNPETLLALGRGPFVSVLVMQGMAFLLSVCSTVDAVLARGYVGLFTTGSILAFLTFGPMVDIKSTLMFLGLFQPRTVLYLILLPLLMTMLAAVWLNLNVAFV
jgi:uncharacterized protein